MSHQRFNMFSPERASILLLIAALCIWAAVTLCRRIPNEAAVAPIGTGVSDTLPSLHKDSSITVSKKENSKRDKSSKMKVKRKGERNEKVNHRDHLNEPVTPF